MNTPEGVASEQVVLLAEAASRARACLEKGDSLGAFMAAVTASEVGNLAAGALLVVMAGQREGADPRKTESRPP